MLRATPSQGRGIVIGSVVTFVLAFAMFWLTRRSIPELLHFGTAVAICFATHHTLSQVRGFWSLYSMRVRAAGGQSIDSLERTMFSCFVPVGLSLILIRWFFIAGSEASSAPFFPVAPQVEAPLPYWFWKVLAAVWLAYGFVLLVSLKPQRQGRAGAAKVAYVCAHMVAISLAIASPIWGAVLSGSLHGLEYVFLCTRMLYRASDDEQGLANRWVVVAVILSMLPLFAVGLTTLPFLPAGMKIEYRSQFDVALITLNSLVLAHYFADACIYRFRVPAIRAAALRRLRFS